MKIQNFVILSVLFIIACTSYDKEKWTEFYGNGIEKGSFDILEFKNDFVGYLGGGISYDTFDEKGTLQTHSDSTILYKTINGGKNWKKINLNQEGEIRGIKFFGDKVCLLNQSMDAKSQISVSTDHEESWKKLIEFEKDDYIRDYEYLKNDDLLVIVSNKSYVTLLKVSDKTDTIKTFSSQHYKAKIKDGKVYMIYNSGGAYSGGILLYDYYSDKETKIPFDKNYWIYATYINDANEFFIAVGDNENETSKIFKLANEKLTEIDIKQYKNYSLGQIYVKGSLIFIDSNKPERVGPIGVTHQLLYSMNGGISWNIENYPFSLMVEPAFLKDDGGFISYEGMNKFQEFNVFAEKVTR